MPSRTHPSVGLSGELRARAATQIAPLLFNLPAFQKYLDILVYTKGDPTPSPLGEGITADHLCRISPGFDSAASVVDSITGRPAAEVKCTKLDVNDAFKGPSSVLAQLTCRRASRGNARRIDSEHILHASVQGRLFADQIYGGERREELMAARADETIAKAVESTGSRCPSVKIEPPSPVSGGASGRVPDNSSSLLTPDDAYKRLLTPTIGRTFHSL